MKVTKAYLKKPALIEFKAHGVSLNDRIFFLIHASLGAHNDKVTEIDVSIWKYQSSSRRTSEAAFMGQSLIRGSKLGIHSVPPSAFRGVRLNQILRYARKSEQTMADTLNEMISHLIVESSLLWVTKAPDLGGEKNP